MEHESPSKAYSDVARRVTERAARFVETRVIVPVPGEPDPDRLANSNRILAEIDAKRIEAAVTEALARAKREATKRQSSE